MAGKDWKKTKVGWKKGEYEIYVNRYSLGEKGSKYAVFLEDPDGDERIVRVNFKTKTEAMRYARGYMRTH